MSKILMLLSAALLLLIAQRAVSQPAEKILTLTDDVSLSIPNDWRRVGRYHNNLEFVKPSSKNEAMAARIHVITEFMKSHADAIIRLGEISDEENAESRFTVVSGWPALVRRRIAPLPSAGKPSKEKEEENYAPPPLVTYVTVAVAAGNAVVRIEATCAPNVEAAVADEMESLGKRFATKTKGDAKAAAHDTGSLKNRLRKRAAPRKPEPAEKKRDKSGALGVPTSGAAVAVQGGGRGELEVAVSNDGSNVVVASNLTSFANSTNGGATFIPRGAFNPGWPNTGDPTLAFGQSGSFYLGFIGFPNGTGCAAGVTGCSDSVAVSNDNGTTFNFRSHAVFCPNGAGACGPDQPHLAADAHNAAAGLGGGDQLYMVWRNFTPAGALTCNAALGGGPVSPGITCSRDGGRNWTPPVTNFDTGDFPRVSVGSDGSAYVVYLQGNNVRLDKFSSCSSGLAQQAGFPVTVTNTTGVTCPMPGLDRCNDGNTLASPMVSVDDTNANHVYVALAATTQCNNPATAAGQRACNDNVIVFDSTDGGLTFNRSVVVNNSTTTARRFLPWVCATGGNAIVSWYDRRLATAPLVTNDLSSYFAAAAGIKGGALRTGTELNLSGNADPQCASGWPFGERSAQDASTCSQAQPGSGRCTGGGACDLTAAGGGGCPRGQACQRFGGGSPKYGDYNGNACSSGKLYAAWASATAPSGAGLPAAAGIQIYSSTLGLPAPNCPVGTILCGAVCANPRTSTYNCGMCFNNCEDSGPAFRCVNGVCRCPVGTRACCGGDICAPHCPRFCP